MYWLYLTLTYQIIHTMLCIAFASTGIADKFSEADRRDLVLAYHRLDAWCAVLGVLSQCHVHFDIVRLFVCFRCVVRPLALIQY